MGAANPYFGTVSISMVFNKMATVKRPLAASGLIKASSKKPSRQGSEGFFVFQKVCLSDLSLCVVRNYGG